MKSSLCRQLFNFSTVHARNLSCDSQAKLIVRCVVKWCEFWGNKKISPTLICYARWVQDSHRQFSETTIWLNGTGNFSCTSPVSQRGPPSPVIPNISIGLNRKRPFHLTSNKHFQKCWLNGLCTWYSITNPVFWSADILILATCQLIPCKQRLHFRCVSQCAKSSLCRQPFKLIQKSGRINLKNRLFPVLDLFGALSVSRSQYHWCGKQLILFWKRHLQYNRRRLSSFVHEVRQLLVHDCI